MVKTGMGKGKNVQPFRRDVQADQGFLWLQLAANPRHGEAGVFELQFEPGVAPPVDAVEELGKFDLVAGLPAGDGGGGRGVLPGGVALYFEPGDIVFDAADALNDPRVDPGRMTGTQIE